MKGLDAKCFFWCLVKYPLTLKEVLQMSHVNSLSTFVFFLVFKSASDFNDSGLPENRMRLYFL